MEHVVVFGRIDGRLSLQTGLDCIDTIAIIVDIIILKCEYKIWL